MTYVMTEPCIDVAALDSQEDRPSPLRAGWTRHWSLATPNRADSRIRHGAAGYATRLAVACQAWVSPV
jgi:hypothetical protein